MNSPIQISTKGSLVALVMLGISLIGIHNIRAKLAQAATVQVEIDDLPDVLGDWKAIDRQGLSVRSRDILQLDRYVKRRYENSAGEQVFIYIGYWAKQSGGHQAAKHSPKVCLPANGWQIRASRVTDLKIPGGLELRANQVNAQIKSRESLFYYWFFTGDTNYHQEWKALLYITLQNFLYGRSDGGLVEITAAIAHDQPTEKAQANADRIVEDFISDFYPVLSEIIRSGIEKS